MKSSKLGETPGQLGVGGKLVAAPLRMPKSRCGTGKISMSSPSDTDDAASKSHSERINSVYDTTDLGAIMGRFYSAVSWRSD